MDRYDAPLVLERIWRVGMLKGFVVRRPCLSIFFLTLVVFMVLQYKPAVLNYTTRFVDFADYMLLNGVTLFPIADDLNPYPDYTVTTTLLVYLFSLPFGRVSILSMGLPSCIAASLMLVFIYRLGALHNRKWGVYGVLFSLLTWAFLDGVNSLALDIYPALFTLICFYIAYSADVKKDPSRLVFLFVGIALGFAFRGPIGLIAPACVIGSYYLLSRQWRMLLLFSVLAGLILAAGMALLAWAAYLQGGDAFLADVLTMQGLGRFSSDRAPRYYFYFSAGLFTYGITVFFSVNVILKKYKQFFSSNRHKDIDLLLYLTGWLLVLLVLFTIPSSKKARYIMAITPAISLLAAYIFVSHEAAFLRAKNGLLKFCLRLPIVGLVMLLLVLLYNNFAEFPLQPNFLGVGLGLCALLSFLHAKREYFVEHRYREFMTLSFGVGAFLILDMFFFNPITYHLELMIEPTPKFLPYWFW
ncbi:ArnT family glycosyltransferase [Pseudomonas sp. SDO52101_S400]